MKTACHLVAVALALGFGPAWGQVEIGRLPLGSGEPGQAGFENATAVDNNIFHVPQYLPGFPTAATIWPRVIEVPCRLAGSGLQCEGYHWTPRMGRAEYLYFRPAIVAAAPVAEAPARVPPPMPAAVVDTPADRPAPAPAVTPGDAPSRPARQDRQ